MESHNLSSAPDFGAFIFLERSVLRILIFLNSDGHQGSRFLIVQAFVDLFLRIPLLFRTIVPPICKSLMVSSFLSNYGTLEYLSSTQRSLPSESFGLFEPFSIFRVQCDRLDHLKINFSSMFQSFIGFNFKGGYLGFVMVVITIRGSVHNSEFSSV